MTAELVAIREALNEMEKKATRKDKIVILTDSLAASISLKSHHKQQARQDLTEEITKKKIHMLRHRREITTQICWIPAHCGIEGNENADQEAKEGIDSETKLNTGLGKKEIYSIIKRQKMEEWQKNGTAAKKAENSTQ